MALCCSGDVPHVVRLDPLLLVCYGSRLIPMATGCHLWCDSSVVDGQVLTWIPQAFSLP